MHPRQRLLRHPWRPGGVHRRRHALPRHLRGRRLQPARLRGRRPAGGERGRRQPPQLAAPALPAARRRLARPRHHARPRPRGHPAPVLRSYGAPDSVRTRSRPCAPGAAAAVRAHGRPAPRGPAHRVHRRGVLRAARGRGGARRRRHQRRGAPLRRPRRPPRHPRGHRHLAARRRVAALPHPDLRRPDRLRRPADLARVRRRPPRPAPRRADDPAGPGGREDPHRRQGRRPAHLPRPGDQRPAARRRRPGAPGRPVRRAAGSPSDGLAAAVAPGGAGRARRGGAHPPAAPLPRPADPLPAHRRPGRGVPPAACTGRRTGARVLGRAVRPAVPEPALPGGLAGAAALPVPAAGARPDGRPRRRAAGRDVPVAVRQRRP